LRQIFLNIRTSQDVQRGYQAIASYTDGALSIEVYADWNTSPQDMLKQANEMRNWSKNVYIKFPTIPEGLKAANEFTRTGGHVNMTLVFDQPQAAAVYSATRLTQGTAFVSPFVGRWDDRGYYGLDIIRNIRQMYDEFDSVRKVSSCHVEILAASIRRLDQMHGAIALGADIITAPLSALQAWVDAGSDRSPSPPTRPSNLQPIEYQELNCEEDYSLYSIDRSESGLLYQGLAKFVKDWQSVVE
jgi:transaldolase